MRNYLMVGFALVAFVAVLAFFMKYPPFEDKQDVAIKDGMTLRHIAERNDIPIEALIPLLPQEKQSSFTATFSNIHKPVKEHNLDKDLIRRTILEAKTDGLSTKDFGRFILWAFWVVAAGLILIQEKRIRRLRRVWLIATLTVFGIVLGAAPNPMEGLVKLHKLIKGVPGNPVVFVTLGFVIFTLLSLLGAKMLCSWGCQLGALQESLYNIPIFKRFKKNFRLPFAASIAVRTTVYLVFFLLLFEILNINQGGPGSILYHHFNLFKIYNPYDLAQFTVLLIPVFFVASFLMYRPFCHTICPFGLWAWLLENVALYKVRKIDTEACVDCGMCEEACPTEAMNSIVENKRTYFRPDCWSCGNCIEACPNDVLRFASALQVESHTVAERESSH